MTLSRHGLLAPSLALVALAFGLGLFESELAPWGDNAQFVVLAQSLTEGKGLREINHPTEPRHRKFPPGWPAMLAPFQLLKGHTSLLGMKLFVLTLFVSSTLLVFFLLRRWTESHALSFAVALLFATNRLALLFAHQIMSEIPYLSLVLLALWWEARLDQRGVPVTRWRGVAVALVAIWAMLVRSVGVALIGALLLKWMLARRFRRCALLFASATLLFSLAAWMRSGGAGVNYADAVLLIDFYDPAAGTVGPAEILSRIASNAARYLLLLPDSLLPLEQAPPLRWVALLLLTVGFLHYLRRLHVAALYFLLYMSVLLLWPRPWAVHRMVVPLLPFSLLFAVKGCTLLWTWLGRIMGNERPRLALSLSLLLLLGAASWNIHDASTQPPLSPGWRAYYRALRWLGRHTDERSVVLCRKPYLAYLLARRKTVSLPRERGRRAFEATLKRHGVTHMIYDRLPLPGTREVLRPRLRAERTRYRLLHAVGSPRTLVLGLKSIAPRGETPRLTPPAPSSEDQANPARSTR